MGWKKATKDEPPAKAKRHFEPWIVSGYYDFKYDMAANCSKPRMLIEKVQLSLTAAIKVLYDEDPPACVLHREEPYINSYGKWRTSTKNTAHGVNG